MKRPVKKLVPVVAIALAALFAVGATAASAHGGRGGPLRGAGSSTRVTQAAKELGIARAKLKDAIADAAVARIDEAVADGDVDKDDGADLKAEAADNLGFAMAISRTRAVASNLSITTAKLNDGFRDARRALILAQIDKALADKRIDKDRADDLRAELKDADLPGYKAGFGFGFGPGLGGPHH